MSVPSLIPLVLLAISQVFSFAHGFATFTPSPSDGIKIVGLPGGQVESLPGMYVQSFRRWIVEDSSNNNNISDGEECAPLQAEPMKGAGLSNLPMDEGWVNPTTTNELWWPRDLDKLQLRPMMNVLFRNGMLSYVSAGLDVRVPHGESDDGSVATWRNYGMNSQPIARQWTTLDIAMENMFHIEGFVLHNEEEYDTLFESLDVKAALSKVATFIAELDSLSPIAAGFHIVSFPIMDSWTDLPSPKESDKKRDKKEDDGEESSISTDDETIYKIVCLATSEPFANKLIPLDEDILTMSSTSVVDVVVSRTAKGGDSPYLTEPYKPLYLSK